MILGCFNCFFEESQPKKPNIKTTKKNLKVILLKICIPKVSISISNIEKLKIVGYRYSANFEIKFEAFFFISSKSTGSFNTLAIPIP
ncbi:hypothetical protein MHTCC0001_03350 [Flavobacteriaceae bacterium MHTCC 0001]